MNPRVSRKLSRPSGARAAVALTVVLTACPQPPSAYEIFVAPKEQVRDSLHILVLAPVSIQTDVKIPDRVLVYLDSLIEVRLSSAGYRTVTASVYDELWTRLMEEAGGFFDPYTGERDDELFDATVEKLRVELRNRFEPDALVFPEIWEVEAEVFYGNVRWDGVEEPVRGLSYDARPLSLIVVVESMDGKELYVNGGGIEIADSSRSQQLFRSDERLARAVEIALDPLTEGRPRG